MGDPSAAYINLVQHLIEKCLLFNMSKEESIDAISKHADIKPVIISTVWKELEKENREFFDAYERGREDRIFGKEKTTVQHVIQKILSDSISTRNNDM